MFTMEEVHVNLGLGNSIKVEAWEFFRLKLPNLLVIRQYMSTHNPMNSLSVLIVSSKANTNAKRGK